VLLFFKLAQQRRRADGSVIGEFASQENVAAPAGELEQLIANGLVRVRDHRIIM
jgi:hypothetical protein